ncbi:rCG56324 [Rattus norvegicus]|uniref:RCG56324 n=1 Tax=Rattus norvegicus TaxID=10116 RepID=A6IBH7_RAT|nr:rCG56324 [Rattus norvegicus]
MNSFRSLGQAATATGLPFIFLRLWRYRARMA